MSDSRKVRPEIVHEITPELITEIEAKEKELEALKATDPKEYERVTQSTEKLRRALNIMRERSRNKL